MPGTIQKRVIGGTLFHMEPLGSTPAGHVALCAGKPLADLFKVKNAEDLRDVAVAIVRQLTREDFDFISETLAGNTTIELRDPVNPKNKPKPVALRDIFEQQFAAKFEERLEWMYWGLEVNFGSFFGVARALFARAGAESNSTDPSAATGGSGDSSFPNG